MCYSENIVHASGFHDPFHSDYGIVCVAERDQSFDGCSPLGQPEEKQAVNFHIAVKKEEKTIKILQSGKLEMW
jgi:hypothetical protein